MPELQQPNLCYADVFNTSSNCLYNQYYSGQQVEQMPGFFHQIKLRAGLITQQSCTIPWLRQPANNVASLPLRFAFKRYKQSSLAWLLLHLYFTCSKKFIRVMPSLASHLCKHLGLHNIPLPLNTEANMLFSRHTASTKDECQFPPTYFSVPLSVFICDWWHLNLSSYPKAFSYFNNLIFYKYTKNCLSTLAVSA